MEKFGVDTTAESEKLAHTKKGNAATRCPVCKAPCSVDGPVIRCPSHGSAPFETK